MKRGDERTQEIDVIIGKRVRALRKLRRLNQNEFAKMIGVTFQQLQKYELATNRISCSRMVVIAEALGVDLIEFFDGLSCAKKETTFSDSEIRLIAKLRKLPNHLSNNLFEITSAI